MQNLSINLWALLGAASFKFFLGGLWYSPLLFAKKWAKLTGVTPQNAKYPPAVAMGMEFAVTLVMAFVLAHMAHYAGAHTWQTGLQTGLWVWLGFVATTTLGPLFFEGTSFSLWLINNGYHALGLMGMGTILAVWGGVS